MTSHLVQKPKYVDRPEITPTFVDSIGLATFDGAVTHIELCEIRMDEPKPPNPPTGRKYPAVRLALHPHGLMDLYNALQRIVGAMEAKGLVQREDGQAKAVN